MESVTNFDGFQLVKMNTHERYNFLTYFNVTLITFIFSRNLCLQHLN